MYHASSYSHSQTWVHAHYPAGTGAGYYAQAPQAKAHNMMQQVPSCSPVPPTHDAHSFDFDLDLLPSSSANHSAEDTSLALGDFRLPLTAADVEIDSCGGSVCSSSVSGASPSQQVPASPESDHSGPGSPTMFSPLMDNKQKPPRAAGPAAPATRYAPVASPQSPYSPAACRPSGSRISSTDSAKTCASTSSSCSSTLQDSLAEFVELQRQVKYEPGQQQQQQLQQFAPAETKATIQVKIEPVELGAMSPPSLLPRRASVASSTSSSLAAAPATPFLNFDAPALPPPPAYSDAARPAANEPVAEQQQQQQQPSDDDDVRGKMEPVLSLAIEQVKSDIFKTSVQLGISQDPLDWTSPDIEKWLLWTMQQYSVPSSSASVGQWASELASGQALMQVSEEEFRQRFPQGGDMVYAQLDIWKTNSAQQQQQQQQQPAAPALAMPEHRPIKKEDSFDISDVFRLLDSSSGSGASSSSAPQQPAVPVSVPHTMALSPPPPYPTGAEGLYQPPQGLYQQQQPQPQHGFATQQMDPAFLDMASPIEQEEEDDEDLELDSGSSPSASTSSASSNSNPPTAPGSAPGSASANPLPTSATGHKPRATSSIHLWQFVKELLLQPHLHSGAIHWLDREKGIFKIVDSTRVATLWGRRKNRPAMNYDKLSRSLRQYYRKGIMKKTERTQRLVYQFCHPYHL